MHPLFPKKGDLDLGENYRGITLTSIAAKIYDALLRNRIVKVKLATVVEGELFNSYYTEVWGGRYSFPWIAPLVSSKPFSLILSIGVLST